eukprot:scaffold24879_cov34-Prasinocladus_malaysianus.AAC.1
MWSLSRGINASLQPIGITRGNNVQPSSLLQGFLYVLEADGEPREGWPVQMGEIQSQPVVADVNGDGFMEVSIKTRRMLDHCGPCSLWPHLGCQRLINSCQ